MCTIDSVWCHSPKNVQQKKKPPASPKHHDGAQDPKGHRKSLHHKTRGRDHHFCFHRNNAQAPGHRTSVLLKDWPMNIGPIFCTESGPGIKKIPPHSDHLRSTSPEKFQECRRTKRVRFQKGKDRSSNHGRTP